MKPKAPIVAALNILILLGSCSHGTRHQRAPSTIPSEPSEIPVTAATPVEKAEPEEKIETKRRGGRIPLRTKLHTIVIPKLEFRQADVADVIEYLHQQSILLDTESPPEDRGVNFILNLGKPHTREPDLPDNGEKGSSRRADDDTPVVTMHIRNVSLWDALRYITEMTGLRFRVDKHAVVITPGGLRADEIHTRVYKVRPDLVDAVVE